uniref:Cytochrome c oxidase subunit 3 n=1 Tax=Physidae sp. PE4 TaxID=2665902 RepID=A0A649UCF1_9GAST|nr:cytochrome c oxidase subunit III [Physidae sp. PE4]
MSRTPFHLVEYSPWPILMSFSSLSLPVSVIYMVRTNEISYLIFNMACATFIITLWLRDVVRESTFQGYHTSYVVKGLKLGFMMFILSEIMFFVGFFWAYFHSSVSPDVALGGVWPATGIITVSPFSIPLINTVCLLSSGVSLTWSHHAIIESKKGEALWGLLATLLLGLFFIFCQIMEYSEATFTISDSVFGSVFYLATGFHGFHVSMGLIMLLVCLIRLSSYHFSTNHHVGFLVSAWYWHFVDVVWLFLFVSMYWWPS